MWEWFETAEGVAALDAIMPAPEVRDAHAPSFWGEVDFGKWSDLSKQEKDDWWVWQAKNDIAGLSIYKGLPLNAQIPLRALGAYSKKNALSDPSGPGWRQERASPVAYEWPFRFKDYWNPTLRAELTSLLMLPDDQTLMAHNWVIAARKRMKQAAKAYTRYLQKEVSALKYHIAHGSFDDAGK